MFTSMSSTELPTESTVPNPDDAVPGLCRSMLPQVRRLRCSLYPFP